MTYPSDWDQRRERVYRRDDYECQNCGATNVELHADHIVPKSRGGNHKMSNLQTLCKSCHERKHGHRIPTGGNDIDDVSLVGGLLLINAGMFTLVGFFSASFILMGMSIPMWALGLRLWYG